MLIDYKILILSCCLCWLWRLDSQAMPMTDLEISGSDFRTTLTDMIPENLLFSHDRLPRHYVVIGAFRELKNATKLISRVASVGFEPKIFLNEKRGLYYVYIVIYDDIASAHRVSSKLREVNFIKDAWVFSTETGEPLSERLIASVDVKSRELLSDTGSRQPEKEVNTSSKSRQETPRETKEVAPAVADNDPAPVQNAEKPKEKASKATFIPTSSKAINQLARADKGEIIIFENLLFHKNSSVLRKISKDEMYRLNEVLNIKSNLRIKIHGHTNGDFKGEVYLLAENDDRFFKLSGKNKVVKGDDKLLSAERAKVIKRYLGAQGINEDRIEIQGWGDRRMLYPKGHLKAPLNRRVEIEVIEN